MFLTLRQQVGPLHLIKNMRFYLLPTDKFERQKLYLSFDKRLKYKGASVKYLQNKSSSFYQHSRKLAQTILCLKECSGPQPVLPSYLPSDHDWVRAVLSPIVNEIIPLRTSMFRISSRVIWEVLAFNQERYRGQYKSF